MAEQSEANVIVNVSFSKHNTRDSHLVLRIRIEVCVQGGPQHMRFARPTYVLVKSSVLQKFGQHVECIGVIFAGRRRCQQTRGQIFTGKFLEVNVFCGFASKAAPLRAKLRSWLRDMDLKDLQSGRPPVQ